MTLKIFVSHSSKYSDLAIKLKLSLQTLEAESHLDIRISEDMAGATNWRQWIEENVRSSDVLLLLYPHPAMEMGWCNYELGRFYRDDMDHRHIVCIRNIGIALPPPAFQPYQSYESSPKQLKKFLDELFVEGTFTNGRALNKEVGRVGTDLYARSHEVSNVLATHFAEARVEERFYERRVVIALRHHDDGRLDQASSTIRGERDDLALLGQASATTWATLRTSLESRGEWLAALEAALPTMVNGALPPALPPYRAASGEIYLPIVVRAEIADGSTRQVSVIFVSTGIELLRPMLGWSFPRLMPQPLTYLVVLFRSIFRARWDILEPSHQAVRKAADAARCKETARTVLSQFEELQQAAERDGITGLGAFFAAFHQDRHAEVQACIDEWESLTKRLRNAAETDGANLEAVLKDLMANNLRWLAVTEAQFSYVLTHLR